MRLDILNDSTADSCEPLDLSKSEAGFFERCDGAISFASLDSLEVSKEIAIIKAERSIEGLFVR